MGLGYIAEARVPVCSLDVDLRVVEVIRSIRPVLP